MGVKKFIQDLFGITQIIEEKRKQTELLKKISEHCSQTERLMDRWVRAHHIR